MSNIVEYDQGQIKLIKDTVCKGATDDEFRQFMYIAKKTGLDPFTKQIYAVKRWNSKLGREEMTCQTGIDGFRVVAERSEKYAGQLGPQWCGHDGKWFDVWLDATPPAAARVGILRADFKEPLWAVAKFDSYKQTNKDGKLTQFWSKMPELMIAKVAEALALRKAFPQDLSSLYTNDEMNQADNEIKDVTQGSTPEIKALNEKAKQNKVINHAPQTKEEAESKPIESIKLDPKTFIFSNGDFKGKRFDQVDPKELEIFMVKLAKEYNEKPMGEKIQAFFDAYQEFKKGGV